MRTLNCVVLLAALLICGSCDGGKSASTGEAASNAEKRETAASKNDSEESRIIKIATEYKQKYGALPDRYEVTAKKSGHKWSVTFWGRPAKPGGHSVVIVGDDGHVISAFPGT